MRKIFCVLAISVGVTGSAAAAEIMDVAQVVGVEPIYSSQYQQECHFETSFQDQNEGQGRSNGGAVVGAVAGGLLGNQVGGGNGKTVATALGAVLGALTGDRVQNDGSSGQAQQRRVCTNQPIQMISGYKVRYAFNGREGNTIMRQQPANTIQVGITAIQN